MGKFPAPAACAVIPADAGIQKPDWMPRIRSGAGLIKSGMTQNTPPLAAGEFIGIWCLGFDAGYWIPGIDFRWACDIFRMYNGEE